MNSGTGIRKIPYSISVSGFQASQGRIFCQTFCKKTPDEIINVGENMKKNYCKNLGEYIEKGMKAQTINQIKKTREIKEESAQVRKKSRSRDDGWEW